MRTDSRLSRMLHVLLHMAHRDQPLTSEAIAEMLGTNPVVVRRTLAGLRTAGYVHAEKGHGGGWSLACDLRDITMLDIHRAVGEPRILAMGHASDQPVCLVEIAVNRALGTVLQEAETLVRDKLAHTTLAELFEDFQAGYPKAQSGLRLAACGPHDKA